MDRDDESDGFVELHPTRDNLGTRLDRYVTDQLPDLSRGTVQGLIESGRVRVDGQQRKPKFRMTPGEVVSVEIPPPRIDEILPDPIPLAIVYEDADVIVVDKPAGMVVHPAPGHPRGTLANALLAHVPGISVGGSQRPGIVHRLDKDTSGLIVAAKTDRGRTALVTQWESRSVEKTYLALVSGSVEDEQATIDAPIGRDPKHRQRMAVVRSGRPAVTHFRVVERFPDTTLLEVSIETGRTHQIRVHLAFIGHPIVGDQIYGRARPTDPHLERQFLHASALGFRLPDGEALRVEAPLPPDLQTVLEELRAKSASFVPHA
jgi:23S rRNA pseudouridine1911/1915/1917 synthase